MVNEPPHYKNLGIEPVAAIEAWALGFNLGNAVKYIARAEHKGAPIEDLKKARWYLDREIQRRESSPTVPTDRWGGSADAAPPASLEPTP